MSSTSNSNNSSDEELQTDYARYGGIYIYKNIITIFTNSSMTWMFRELSNQKNVSNKTNLFLD